MNNTIEIKHMTNHELVVKVNEDGPSGTFFVFHLNREAARSMFLDALKDCFVPGTDDLMADWLLSSDLGAILRKKMGVQS